MDEQARISIKINGRVQGVFFRLRTKEMADKLELTGWVKNNQDGWVEVLAEGDKDKLEKLRDWSKQGSEHAKVDKVIENWLPYSGEFVDFKIN